MTRSKKSLNRAKISFKWLLKSFSKTKKSYKNKNKIYNKGFKQEKSR